MSASKTKLDPEYWADVLFEAFKGNVVDMGDNAVRVSEEGLDMMSKLFGAIPMLDRGYVYMIFLANLHAAGYMYDAQQFTQMEKQDDTDPTT